MKKRIITYSNPFLKNSLNTNKSYSNFNERDDLLIKNSSSIICLTSYYNNGNIKNQIWYQNNIIHKENGPAKIYYYQDGTIDREIWYYYGIIHRNDGPAKIYYYENGSVDTEIWFQNGKRYREKGPIHINYDENGNILLESWYGELKYRNDGPIYISYYQPNMIDEDINQYRDKRQEIWILDEENTKKFIKEDKPNIINYYQNGNIQSLSWAYNLKLNKICNPLLFRLNGPAYIFYDINGDILLKRYHFNLSPYYIKNNIYKLILIKSIYRKIAINYLYKKRKLINNYLNKTKYNNNLLSNNDINNLISKYLF
jgi:antitoxin component YwqK of YwqJK toxin-antitoxin module